MKYFLIFLGIIWSSLYWVHTTFAAINFTVTPIKYELELQPGESITLPASIRNNGPETVTLPTTASDFQSRGTDGTPSFVRKSELVFPDQQLSTWISIEKPSVTLAPGEEKTTNFTIHVPTNATPGGHYWAVLFKNDNSEKSTSGDIWINVDYGIIILVTVAGEIYVDITPGETSIAWGGRAPQYDICKDGDHSGSIFDGECEGDFDLVQVKNQYGELVTLPSNKQVPLWYEGTDEQGTPVYSFPDECPWGDFTPSRYDSLCLQIPFIKNTENTLPNKLATNAQIDNSFEVDFQFPFENAGNVHIIPEGKIILRDEDGNTIKAIGKTAITNEDGAVIGEQIVDYIPINDEGGSILPGSKRIFESSWNGFPYKEYDDEGNQVINYWSPSEYYTQKNKDQAGFLMFWERVSEVRTHKNITAEISMTYYDEEWNPIEFNSAQEFPVQYIEQRITPNPLIILALLLFFTAFLMLWGAYRWWILVWKRKRCWNCKEKIKAHWETCPHCQAIQNKKRDKRFKEALKEDQQTVQSKKPVNKKKTTKLASPVKKTPVKKATSQKSKRSTTSKTQATPKKKVGRPRKTQD
jgi:hypothetical protein